MHESSPACELSNCTAGKVGPGVTDRFARDLAQTANLASPKCIAVPISVLKSARPGHFPQSDIRTSCAHEFRRTSQSCNHQLPVSCSRCPGNLPQSNPRSPPAILLRCRRPHRNHPRPRCFPGSNSRRSILYHDAIHRTPFPAPPRPSDKAPDAAFRSSHRCTSPSSPESSTLPLAAALPPAHACMM